MGDDGVNSTETKSSEHLSAAKRAQILKGARAMFMQVGYERASMDAIAKRASVSKATIYNHFQDKQALFIAGFGAETDASRAAFMSMLDTPTGDLEADLGRIGQKLLHLVVNPANLDRHRLVMAETGHLPELGRALHASGAALGQAKMIEFFRRALAQGLIRPCEPAHAAEDFAALCIGDLLRNLQMAIIDEVSEATIDDKVARAVQVFLRAYGTHQ